MISGVEPPQGPTGVAYPVALVVLGLLVLALFLLVLGEAVRIARPRSRPRAAAWRAGRIIGSSAAVGLVIVGLLAVPRVTGVGLDQLGLWAPDLSWLIHAAIILAALLVPLQILVALRAAHRARSRSCDERCVA